MRRGRRAIAPRRRASAIHSRIRSWAAGVITGPTSVASSAGSPTTRPSTRHEAPRKPSRCRPLDVDALHADASLAGERERVRGELRSPRSPGRRPRRRSSASSCPARARTCLRGARSGIPQPTRPEPVNVIIFTRSSSTNTSPISAPGPATTFSQPGRQSGVLLELGQQQGRQRRRARRLEHDRASCGDRGGDLVRDQVQREVEGAIAPMIPIGA